MYPLVKIAAKLYRAPQKRSGLDRLEECKKKDEAQLYTSPSILLSTEGFEKRHKMRVRFLQARNLLLSAFSHCVYCDAVWISKNSCVYTHLGSKMDNWIVSPKPYKVKFSGLKTRFWF